MAKAKINRRKRGAFVRYGADRRWEVNKKKRVERHNKRMAIFRKRRETIIELMESNPSKVDIAKKRIIQKFNKRKKKKEGATTK